MKDSLHNKVAKTFRTSCVSQIDFFKYGFAKIRSIACWIIWGLLFNKKLSENMSLNASDISLKSYCVLESNSLAFFTTFSNNLVNNSELGTFKINSAT